MLHMSTLPSPTLHGACAVLLSSRDALAAGDLPSTSLDFPVRPEWEKDWVPNTGVKLASAYKQVEGKEPDFTNNAKVRTTKRCCCSATDCTNISTSTDIYIYTYIFFKPK